MQKPKKKRKPNKRYILWGLIIGLFCAAILLAVSFAGFWILSGGDGNLLGTTLHAQGEEAIQAIGDFVNTPLPKEVDNAYIYTTAFQDFVLYARFDISSQDFKPWLDQSILCFGALVPSTQPFVNVTVYDWWQPETAKKAVVGEECGNNPYYSLLVDQTDANVWTVYLYSFSI